MNIEKTGLLLYCLTEVALNNTYAFNMLLSPYPSKSDACEKLGSFNNLPSTRITQAHSLNTAINTLHMLLRSKASAFHKSVVNDDSPFVAQLAQTPMLRVDISELRTFNSALDDAPSKMSDAHKEKLLPLLNIAAETTQRIINQYEANPSSISAKDGWDLLMHYKALYAAWGKLLNPPRELNDKQSNAEKDADPNIPPLNDHLTKFSKQLLSSVKAMPSFALQLKQPNLQVPLSITLPNTNELTARALGLHAGQGLVQMWRVPKAVRDFLEESVNFTNTITERWNNIATAADAALQFAGIEDSQLRNAILEVNALALSDRDLALFKQQIMPAIPALVFMRDIEHVKNPNLLFFDELLKIIADEFCINIPEPAQPIAKNERQLAVLFHEIKSSLASTGCFNEKDFSAIMSWMDSGESATGFKPLKNELKAAIKNEVTSIPHSNKSSNTEVTIITALRDCMLKSLEQPFKEPVLSSQALR